jgi:hypothetical protein
MAAADLGGEVSFTPVPIVAGVDGKDDFVSGKLGERIADGGQDRIVVADGAIGLDVPVVELLQCGGKALLGVCDGV